jgi:hypothetical protein
VNGASLGTRSPDAYRIVEWPNVALKKGNNVVAVRGVDATGRAFRDGAVWIYDGQPWMAVVPAFFRWCIKPLYALSFLKLLVLYFLGFRVAWRSRNWRWFWRVCFVLCALWCVALVGAYAFARAQGFGLFDYSQF